MNRRSFLRLTGLAGAAIIALPSLGYMAISNKEAAVKIITNELHYLTLDKAGVEQFVDEYFKVFYLNESIKTKIKTQFSLKSSYYLGSTSQDSHLVSLMVRVYLLSSDFFINKMDEKRTVKYVAVHNPFAQPCSNPFSALYYPSAA